MLYVEMDSVSTVDMLRFRLRFSGKPGEGFDWFEDFCAHVRIEFDNPDEDVCCVRYARSLRLGTYREMIVIPVGKSSIVVGYGRNGKGDLIEMREGFIEFNPSKCYPSRELAYVYKLLMRDGRIRLELSRWDFATDYEVPRSGVALLKDKRRYAFLESNGITEYLGRRSHNGFVKLYDKQAELIKQGEECPNPKTRLEITIEERAGKKKCLDEDGNEILENEWPTAVLVPAEAIKGTKGTFGVLVAAWAKGCNFEYLMTHLGRESKRRYRKRIKEEIGGLKCPVEYGECRKDAYAWETCYGGLRGA